VFENSKLNTITVHAKCYQINYCHSLTSKMFLFFIRRRQTD
jgi:hypothetical protein